MRDLGTLPGDSSSDGLAVNDLGEVAGNSVDASGVSHAFLWTPRGGMRELMPPGGASSDAAGINDLAEVVGYSFRSTSSARSPSPGRTAALTGGHDQRGCSTSDQAPQRRSTTGGKSPATALTAMRSCGRLRVDDTGASRNLDGLVVAEILRWNSYTETARGSPLEAPGNKV
jgi:probable HAF family extracellular repeat protein